MGEAFRELVNRPAEVVNLRRRLLPRDKNDIEALWKFLLFQAVRLSEQAFQSGAANGVPMLPRDTDPCAGPPQIVRGPIHQQEMIADPLSSVIDALVFGGAAQPGRFR